jgi:hypothetical protein
MKACTAALAARVVLVVGCVFGQAAHADFLVRGPDGRRIVLHDDGTWRYLDVQRSARAAEAPKDQGEAELVLRRKIENGNNCGFVVRLSNQMPYEIRNLVLHYAALRADGVVYDTVSSKSGFGSLRPGDSQDREFQFLGIPCKDIARVQVVGGDRCEMGDLHKFSEGRGRCLARVRVVESDLVRFDK